MAASRAGAALVFCSLVVAVGGESVRPSSFGLAYGYWHQYSMANGSILLLPWDGRQ